MKDSLAMMHTGLRQHAISTQFIAQGIVPMKKRISTLQFLAAANRGGTH